MHPLHSFLECTRDSLRKQLERLQFHSDCNDLKGTKDARKALTVAIKELNKLIKKGK